MNIKRFLQITICMMGCLIFTPFALAAQSVQLQNNEDASAVLASLHESAANADWDRYFSLFDTKASFIGTDMTEHWNMSEFEKYARATSGWRYNKISQTLTQEGNVVVFDEILKHEKYGISRGTGTLIHTDAGWKILQYHLSFPIPNGIAARITDQINLYRSKQKASAAVSQ